MYRIGYQKLLCRKRDKSQYMSPAYHKMLLCDELENDYPENEDNIIQKIFPMDRLWKTHLIFINNRIEKNMRVRWKL